MLSVQKKAKQALNILLQMLQSFNYSSACTCNLIILEAEFWKGVDSTPVRYNNCSDGLCDYL